MHNHCHSERAYTRRQFISAAALAVTGITVSTHSTLRASDSQKPPAVIDTHTHFYNPIRPEGVPWPPSHDKLLYRTVLPRNYRALPVPTPVTGTIVVEASPWIEDNQWVLDLAANDPFILGLVGNLPVGTKEFAGHLKRFAADKRFRGIRLRDRDLNGTLENPDFFNDLKLLADHGLSLDLVNGGDILEFAARLSKKLPDLRIIIDHLAGLKVDGKAPPSAWLDKMKALIPSTQVLFKLSGLVEGTGRSDGSAPRAVEFYRPVLDAMQSMFGPGRLIYASNWPVSERYAPLATVQGIIEDYFRGMGTRAREQVFSLTGKVAYRSG